MTKLDSACARISPWSNKTARVASFPWDKLSAEENARSLEAGGSLGGILLITEGITCAAVQHNLESRVYILHESFCTTAQKQICYNICCLNGVSSIYHLFSSNVGSSKQQRRRAPTSETEPSSASGASSCGDVESKHLPYSSFNFQRLPASLAIWFGVTKASTWSFAMQRDLLLLETHPTNPRRCSTLSLSVAAKKSNRPGSSSCSWRIPIVWKHRRLCHAASASLRKTNVDIFGSWPSNGSVCFETV